MRKGDRTTLKIDHLSYFAIWTFFYYFIFKTTLYFNNHKIHTRGSKVIWHKMMYTNR